MSRRWRNAAALVCAAVALDCADIPTGPLGGTPPQSSLPLIVPKAILDSALEAGDSLRFRLVVQGPVVQRLFVWLDNASAADSVSVSLILPEPTIEMGAVVVGGADAVRRRWIFVPGMATATEFIVVVRSESSEGPLAFSLSLEPRDIRPEHADSVLVVGDTVVESTDGANDVDDFKVTGVEGKRLLLYVGKRGVVQPTALNLVLITPGGWAEHQSLQAAGNHTLDERAVPLNVPAGQTWTVRVSSDQVPEGGTAPAHMYFNNGEYLLRLVALDGAPESRADAAALGDTISEGIDFAGDVDEFRIPDVVGLRSIAVGFRLLDSVGLPVRFEVWRGYDLMGTYTSSAPNSSFDDAITLPFPVSTGNTVVRVVGGVQGVLEQILTSYQVEIFEVNTAPESVAPALTLGNTVMGEQLERLRDVDEFTLDLTAGAAYRVEMVGPVRGELIQDATYSAWGLTAHVDSNSGLRASAAITPTTSGPARLRVWADEDVIGPYQLTVYSLNPDPENASPVLAVNTFVEDAVDHAGDLDRYTLTAPTSARYLGFLRRKIAPGVFADSIFIGPVERSAGQTLDLSASSLTWPFVFGQQLQYEIGAFAIDTMPEERPEAFAIGDTVVGVVDLRADVDVYKLTYSGPGEKLFRINWLQAPACFDDYPSMTMHVSISGEWSWGVYSPSTWQANNETFALSVPGTYSVRVASRYASWDGVGCHIPQYAFTIEEVTRP